MAAHPAKPDASLSAFLANAEAGHAAQPAATLRALQARAPALPPKTNTYHTLRLAEHVALAHLGDTAGLAAFAAALPEALGAHADTAAAITRLHWVLDTARGMPAGSAPPDAVRWHALQNLVLALAWQGRCEAASALLAADEEAARAHGSSDAGVAYAVSANNVALDLQMGGPRSAAHDALMLRAATIARRAWAHAGTWRHVERAEYRLAWCHAVAGQGAAAVHHARLCLAGCQAAGDAADAVEHFFAHEALARAHSAAGDGGAVQAARAQMAALLPQIDEADELRA